MPSRNLKLIALLVVALVCSQVAIPGSRPAATILAEELTQNIPPRASQGLTGSGFAKFVSPMNPQQREQAIKDEILKGNVPEFLRKLVPVDLSCELLGGKILRATIFVTPDYLSIGSDDDFLRIPMNLHTALAVADQFGFTLPTRKMVDAIYRQSRYHFAPQPLTASPEMRSTAYYWTHNQMIDAQANGLGVRLGALVSGDKKDIVLTNLLFRNAGKIAIYGWHRGPGDPIQPLSTVHGANYADYSHGVRLVSDMALIDGHLRSVFGILQDPLTAKVLSDEGPIRNLMEFFAANEYSPASPAVSALNN